MSKKRGYKKYYIIYRVIQNAFMLDYIEFLACTPYREKARTAFDLITEHMYPELNISVAQCGLLELDMTKHDADLAGHLYACATDKTINIMSLEYNMFTQDADKYFTVLNIKETPHSNIYYGRVN